MSGNDNENAILPLKKGEEFALAVARGLMGELPFGGLLLEVLPFVLPERIKKFFGATENELNNLLASGNLKVEDLVLDENFVSVLLSAVMIATRTHQEEKLQILRNAVINSALPNSPEDDLQHMYLNFIERLTPWHIRILRFLDTSLEQKKDEAKLPAILEKAFPDLLGREDFYIPIIDELFFLNLVIVNPGSTLVSFGEDTRAVSVGLTTKLGREFLNYIDNPANKINKAN